jgi:predicted RNA-binding protein YlqC (UPF0109 family)
VVHLHPPFNPPPPPPPSALPAKIEAYEATVTTIVVDSSALPAIIGKGGENIKVIRKATKATIEIDWDASKIRIQSNDDDQVQKAKEDIMEIVRNNQVEIIVVGQPLLPLLLGVMGKPVRNKIIDEIGVKLEVIQDTRDIKVRGTKEKIDKAVVCVKEFLAANYTTMYEVAAEDTSLLLGGGADSVIKTLAGKFECDVHMQRDTNMVRIRGVQEKVEAAIADLKKTIHGGDGVVVEDLKVAENVMGKVIGKGGAKISEIEVSERTAVAAS